ncbi:uncharacterized protein LOC108713439 [Xenopus laevis]|uniref:Uncharacterized protein LOC108713439 n=2 Tax=Xenopus laevis TaxID=8355 RepID=A0A1L8GI73_XENLA|nr:uncharacterized protein LOC108713439 [Xenopus laevis]OCT83545.1 hypothetical protein XELAEV_18021687mg [Xenopus laevis]
MGPPGTQKWLINSPTPPVIISVLLMSLSLSGTDSLGVKTSDFPIKFLRNQEAFIPCTITDYGAGELDVKLLSVSWTLKSLSGSDEVYLYVSGTHNRTRPGSYISDSEIIRGNVALHLPRVQFTDEGEYTCTVFYTPNKVVGHSTLQVSVQPTGSLQPPAGSVVIGTEKTVQCEANGFYPKDITIQWVKRLSETNCISLDKDSCTGDPLDKQSCTGDPSGNEDGTFNVTSQLRISPSLEDDGRRYLCIIKHRSLENELKLNFTLSVTEPPPEDKTTVPLVVGIFFTLIIAALCYFLYWKFLKKEPPKLSPITGAEHLVHMNRATLSCLISGFRPKPIRITLWLKRNGGEEMEIDSWDSETQTGSSAPVSHHREEQRVVIDQEKEELVSNGETNLPPAQRPLQVEMFPIITTSKSQRLSNCQCTIHITPDIEEDDGAELTVKVTHSALRLPISESCRLKVRGVKPRLSRIVSPLHILHGEPLTLTCPINGFKPKPLLVTWLKVDSNGRETELLSWDQGTTNINDPNYSHHLAEDEREKGGEEEDDMNYFVSNLTLTPTVKEYHGTQYVCRTHHYTTEHTAEKRMEMQVLAVPELDPIENSPEVLCVGEAIKLSCRIHSFHPQTLDVSWYKENEILTSYNDPILHNASGLFHFTSRITYTPCVKDIGKKFRCEVSHPSLQNPKCVSWELKHLTGEPRVSAIKCDPEVPGCNQTTTLSCTIEKFYPKDLKIRWYRGLEVIESESDPEGAKEDPESGLFSRTTEIQIIPTINDHGKQFHLEIMYRTMTAKKTFYMRLKGLPEVKDIIFHNYPPKYGEPLTLSCEVSECNGRDVTAEWQIRNNPITRGMRTETKTNRDSVSFLLTLTPTAEHYGKLFTCLIKHKDLPELIKKNICLKLPEFIDCAGSVLKKGAAKKNMEVEATADIGKEPQVGEIECVTPNPRKGESVTLQCKIKGQDVEHGDFSWSDGIFPIDENLIDNSNLTDGSGCISKVTFTPDDDDDGEIRFEATFNFVATERTFQLPRV